MVDNVSPAISDTRVLPASELLLLALSAAARRILGRRVGGTYQLNFRRAIEHFCVHAAALGVVDAVQRGIGLSDGDVEASRMTLHRFGYTSSSSVMYGLVYIEAKDRMRKRDRVWMISFGGGFECTSVAWECVEPRRARPTAHGRTASTATRCVLLVALDDTAAGGKSDRSYLWILSA